MKLQNYYTPTPLPFFVTFFSLKFLYNYRRCREEDLIVAMDSTTGRILHCDKTASKKQFSFPLVMN